MPSMRVNQHSAAACVSEAQHAIASVLHTRPQLRRAAANGGHRETTSAMRGEAIQD